MNIRYLKVLSCVLASTLILNFAPTKVEAKNLTGGQKALIGTGAGTIGLLTLCGLIFWGCRNHSEDNAPPINADSGVNSKPNSDIRKFIPKDKNELAKALWDWSRSVDILDMNAFDAVLNIYSLINFGKKYQELVDDIKISNSLGPEATYSNICEFVTANPSTDKEEQKHRLNICFLLKYRAEYPYFHDYSAPMPEQFRDVASVVFVGSFMSQKSLETPVLQDEPKIKAIAEECKKLECGTEPSFIYVDP